MLLALKQFSSCIRDKRQKKTLDHWITTHLDAFSNDTHLFQLKLSIKYEGKLKRGISDMRNKETM